MTRRAPLWWLCCLAMLPACGDGLATLAVPGGPGDPGGPPPAVIPPPAALTDVAELVSLSAPAQAVVGAAVPVEVTLRNAGTSTWTPAAGVAVQLRTLASTNLTMPPPTLALPRAEVAPGEQATFVFEVTPLVAGPASFELRLAREGQPFGPTVAHALDATVAPAAYDAELVSVSVPATAAPAAVVQVRVVLRNKGGETWTEAADHSTGVRLRTTATNSVAWAPGAAGGAGTNLTHQHLYLAAPVPPGTEVTLAFSLKLSSKAGPYQLGATLDSPTGTAFGPTLSEAVTVVAPTVPPQPGGTTSPNGFSLATVHWTDANPSAYPVTSTLQGARVTQSHVCWDAMSYPADWPPYQNVAGQANANQLVIAYINGQWWGGDWEALTPAYQTAACRILEAVVRPDPLGHPEWGPFAQVEDFPFWTWQPQSGDWVGLMMSTWVRNFNVPAGPTGRSEVMWTRWP